MAKLLIFLALLVLPGAIFLWARTRRPKPLTIDPRIAHERIKNGEPMKGELARAYLAYATEHSRQVIALVEQVFTMEEYGLVLEDGRRVRASRNKGMWKRGMVPAVGQKVLLSMIPGDERGTIQNML
ncbi:MAG: hypothetical protein WKG00_08615 [Polyangiaceae bacterium]